MATKAKNGISKYAQNTKINPAMSKKPKILIKPIPNLKKSQIKKIVNKSESINSYLHNLWEYFTTKIEAGSRLSIPILEKIKKRLWN